jgi:hypothetical protein
MLSRDQNAEECDARNGDRSGGADYKKNESQSLSDGARSKAGRR